MELRKIIKEEQKRGNVLQRLIFTNDLYDGKNAHETANNIDVKAIAYEWLKRCNRDGYGGLISKFAGYNP